MGADVEVTWKLLEAPSQSNTTICEVGFDMDELWNEKQKETLACLKIDTQIKACCDLKPSTRSRIKGCENKC